MLAVILPRNIAHSLVESKYTSIWWKIHTLIYRKYLWHRYYPKTLSHNTKSRLRKCAYCDLIDGRMHNIFRVTRNNVHEWSKTEITKNVGRQKQTAHYTKHGQRQKQQQRHANFNANFIYFLFICLFFDNV